MSLFSDSILGLDELWHDISVKSSVALN